MYFKLKFILFTFLINMSFFQIGQAQISIDVVGNWDLNVSSDDLLEAGSDYAGTYTSNNNQVLIDIFQANFFSNFFFNYGWRVDIRKTDIDWDNSLVLRARRTGNGSAFFFNGPINGGTNYVEITNANQTFFQGRRTRLDIPIQYELSGVSLLLPAKTYETTIIYTVTEQ